MSKKAADSQKPEDVESENGAEVAEEPNPDPAAENAKLLDRLMRLQAEYENYRKRVSREQIAWSDRAKERLVLDLLPVQDSFDRAIGAAEGSADAEALLEGMKLVHRQLVGALERHGVKPVDALGETFDPQLHEAFASRPATEGEEPGTIVDEIEKGYAMGDRVIRATRGIVAVAPASELESPASPEEE